ncbi:MAG: ribonuclease H-like domain-containing protein [Clostridia bacterium]|nr:ribonuclease H-like domain-containing protein [Clostridia bacterium]
MTAEIIEEIRSVGKNLSRAILRGLTLDRARRTVTANIITDEAFTPADERGADAIIRKFVPDYFESKVIISKLAPDEEMVRRKIEEAVCACSNVVYATLGKDDIKVKKTENGFEYRIAVAPSIAPANLCEKVNEFLTSRFCGSFSGECVVSDKNLEDLEVEERQDEIEFEMPVRTFTIEDFEILEGEKIRTTAVYMSDLNLVGDEVIICGTIEDIRERTYTNKKGVEKTYFNFVLSDTTSRAYATYFPRLKTIEKIKQLKVGDSIVCTGLNESFNGNLRYTAKTIDFGRTPKGFVPEKRASKPVPKYYKTVHPEPYTDFEQTFLFKDRTTPACLKNNTFVVFDLETTGLNSSPVSGNMDKIIEIGAYKITDGEISECFSTFINPERKLSEEIINLTGITEDMVADAPKTEEVMPDFFKFCQGSILVGHNIAGFDFKFIDHYCANCGYILERKIIDTIPLSQELLFLSNYKLNTVADKFNIAFNHHRATDDALATAKIFMELIKMKKSLPKFQ